MRKVRGGNAVDAVALAFGRCGWAEIQKAGANRLRDNTLVWALEISSAGYGRWRRELFVGA